MAAGLEPAVEVLLRPGLGLEDQRPGRVEVARPPKIAALRWLFDSGIYDSTARVSFFKASYITVVPSFSSCLHFLKMYTYSITSLQHTDFQEISGMARRYFERKTESVLHGAFLVAKEKSSGRHSAQPSRELTWTDHADDAQPVQAANSNKNTLLPTVSSLRSRTPSMLNHRL